MRHFPDGRPFRDARFRWPMRSIRKLSECAAELVIIARRAGKSIRRDASRSFEGSGEGRRVIRRAADSGATDCPADDAPALPDVQRRAPRQTRQQARQIAGAQRHAARRRREIFRRDMKEDRAAAPAHGRANIMVEHANEVVEPIRTPQVLMAKSRRTAQMTIVEKALGVVAPNVVLSRLARRREKARPRKSRRVG